MSRSLACLLAPLFCVSCVSRDALPDIPEPPAPVTMESQVVGCYSQVGPYWSIRYDAPWEAPRTFYLTDRLLSGAVEIDGRIVAHRWVTQAHAYRASAHWRLEGVNTIYLTWTTGFQGVWVRLRRGSTDEVWHGRSVPFSDDGTAPAGVEIAVSRISDDRCDFPH